MAESDGGQDKTEEPTQKRLEKAAEDGQIASSKELFVFTTLAMGFLLYYAILFVSAAPFDRMAQFFFNLAIRNFYLMKLPGCPVWLLASYL